MTRRGRASPWARSLQRSLQRSFSALTRSALRAGTQAVRTAAKKTVKRASKAAAAKRTLPVGPGRWVTGVALAAGGARRYRLYVPPGVAPGPRAAASVPLVVMLHGCGQDAASFARSTRIHRLAAREGCFLLFPEQERMAHAQGCWNWFQTRSGRAQGEAGSILAAIDHVLALYPIDASRVAVAGLSAGAGMAALLALHHPERFAAVALHSGIGPSVAHSSASALAAMQGRGKPAAPAGTGVAPLPPLLVIHGGRDHVVAPGNGRAVATWWAAALGARAGAPRDVQRGQRHPYTVTDFKAGASVAVTLVEVPALGHAWSGGAAAQPFSDPHGPDASRMIWSFAARQFRRGG